MFISTPSLEPGNNSQGTESSKKLPHQNNPSATESGSPKQTGPAEQLKKSSSSGSQPSEVTECFQLELNSENSSFAQKTQLFIVEEDSQATQIVEEEGTVGADKSNSNPKHHSQNASKNVTDPEPVTTSNSQSLSRVPDSKSTEKAEDCNPSQKLSQGVNVGNQSISTSPGATPSQLVGADCVSDTPNVPQTSKTTVADCSQASPSADRLITPVSVPQQSPSQSVLTGSSQKNTEKEKESVSQSQRLSQPMTLSHSVVTDSVINTAEEERMDEGEIQREVTGDDTGIKLGLSQSQVHSPEPMEEENGEEEKETSQREPTRDDHSSSKEESFSVMVLEESQRVSQEKVKDGRSQPFISSSQPVRGSVQNKREATAKISGSQPVGSTEVSPLQLERAKSQSTQPSDAGQHKKNSDNATNRSLSDSSGGGIKPQTSDLLSLLIMEPVFSKSN